jgi:histidinol dehydrogenase
MMRTLDLRGRDRSAVSLLASVPRATSDLSSALDVASELIADVVSRGELALREQAKKFDGGVPASIRVDPAHLRRALEQLDAAVREGLEIAIDRVRQVSINQVPPATVTTLGPGAVVEQRWVAVSRVGLYVPGGKAVYPSSVAMNVVPAQVAGVTSIALVSPPQRDFEFGVHPTVLAAAQLLGIDEVYAMGGAGAVGALAHGVSSLGLDPVDVITGPGNIFVAAAKRLVRGIVGIDSEAGPTEILIIADDTADADLVAADLISQAEHDPMAAAVLVTDSVELAEAVLDRVTVRGAATAHAARVAQALDGSQSAVIIVDDMAHAVALSNAYAPEHLEVHTRDDEALVPLLINAGAIFVGKYAPVSLGDYAAGSNHVLPTLGQSRFSSALGAYTFLRAQQVIRYDAVGLTDVARQVRALSDAENLPAHGDAVDARNPGGL